MPDVEKPDSLPRTANPTRSSKWDHWWLLLAAVAAVIVALSLFRPDPFRRIVVFMGDGVLVTVSITIVAYVLILGVGLIAGLGRISKTPIVHAIASVYVEVVRGIPLLVQLLFIYYALPVVLQSFGGYLVAHAPALRGVGEALSVVKIDPFVGAVFGLTLCYGAYVGEIYRAGIESVPRGQMEAARSLGMTYVQAMRYVVLPQAIRTILPPLGNEFVALLKDSSLVSVVAVADMTRRGREFMSKEFNPLETWLMVALLYLMLTVFSARIVSYVERKNTHGR